jgi:hypothetical protein
LQCPYFMMLSAPGTVKPLMCLEESSPWSPVQALTVDHLASAWFHTLSRLSLSVH